MELPSPKMTKPRAYCAAAPPSFIVPVEVRSAHQYGTGQKGVFAISPIKKGSKVRQQLRPAPMVHKSSLPRLLEAMSETDAAMYLRQAFVSPDDLDHLVVDFDDAVRFLNHSAKPNIDPAGRALRDILPDEELVIDYMLHGDPGWYREACARYGVLTERQVAEVSQGSGGQQE